MHYRFLACLYVGEVEAVRIDAYLPDKVRVGLGEVFDFAHYLAVEFQVDQVGLCIAVYGYGLIEVSQCFRIEGYTDRSFLSGSDRGLSPPGYGAGAIGLYAGKHQRLVAGVRYGVLHRCRVLPLNLAEVVHFRIGGKTRLRYGCRCRSDKRI